MSAMKLRDIIAACRRLGAREPSRAVAPWPGTPLRGRGSTAIPPQKARDSLSASRQGSHAMAMHDLEFCNQKDEPIR